MVLFICNVRLRDYPRETNEIHEHLTMKIFNSDTINIIYVLYFD